MLDESSNPAESGSVDCLWGALDGVNEAGLTAELSFGVRNVSGTGFGIPLLLRHVLEVAQNTAEAIQLLQRVPASMCYSITLLDRHDDWATVFVSPDRPTEVSRQRVVTNLQHEVEWPQHAQATHAVQRRDTLQSLIDTPHTLHQVSQALLHAPFTSTASCAATARFTAQSIGRAADASNWPGRTSNGTSRWPTSSPGSAILPIRRRRTDAARLR